MAKPMVSWMRVLVIVCLMLMAASQVRASSLGVSPLDYSGNHCLSFNGIGDYVSCGLVPAYKASSLSVELWIKPLYTIQNGSDAEYGHKIGELVTYWYADQGYGWRLEFDYSAGLLNFVKTFYDWYYMNTYLYMCSSVRNVWYNDSWYHIAATFGSQVSFYVNATADSQHNVGVEGGISYSNTDLRIGGHAGKCFGGLIDEVRYWNKTLTSTEIKSRWNRVLNGTELQLPELIGYWRFDEGMGDTAVDSSMQNNAAMLAAAPYDPSWVGPGAPIMPEFPSFLILPLFMTATLLGAIAFRMKKRSAQ